MKTETAQAFSEKEKVDKAVLKLAAVLLKNYSGSPLESFELIGIIHEIGLDNLRQIENEIPVMNTMRPIEKFEHHLGLLMYHKLNEMAK